MKKTDIALIIFIAAVSVLIAYFVANAVIGSPEDQSVTVPSTSPITSSVAQPSDRIFNSEAINPTVEICIGGGCGPTGTPTNPDTDDEDDTDDNETNGSQGSADSSNQ
jgi:hypothetical protein